MRLHFLFFAALGVMLFTDLRDTALLGVSGAAIHEGGHLLVMRLCGIPPERVVIQPFGVLIYERQGCARTNLREGLVSLGGPLLNGAAAGCALLAQRLALLEASPFILVNGALGLFNLLPVEDLDGGRALGFFLSVRLGPDRSARIVTIVSVAVLLPLGVLGFLLLLESRYNFSLLLASVYLMLCLVLKNSRMLYEKY